MRRRKGWKRCKSILCVLWRAVEYVTAKSVKLSKSSVMSGLLARIERKEIDFRGSRRVWGRGNKTAWNLSRMAMNRAAMGSNMLRNGLSRNRWGLRRFIIGSLEVWISGFVEPLFVVVFVVDPRYKLVLICKIAWIILGDAVLVDEASDFVSNGAHSCYHVGCPIIQNSGFYF